MSSYRSLVVAAFAMSIAALGGCKDKEAPAPAPAQASTSEPLSADGGGAEGEGEGKRRHRGASPEAAAACKSKAVGDACTLTFHDKAIEGTCTAPHAGAPDAQPFCAPKGGHGGPGGPEGAGGPPH